MTTDPRFYLVISVALMAITALWLMQIAKKFRYTARSGEVLPFTIIDIQFPASEAEMDGMIAGMQPEARQALKAHLRLDFLFMAGFYPAIALLCIIIGAKTGLGEYFFWLVASLQGVAWAADICENVYCLRKMRHPPANGGFRSYSVFVNTKFVLAFLGGAVTLPLAFYFWMTGEFWHSSLLYLCILAGEILVFLLIALYNISRSRSSTP
jgi:hypothetical protein